jgi:DNA (cytosine-5)-methyltransferase 1
MRLLDLFCGAGGAAMGYYRAGYTEIVGVDIHPQKRYPFTFVQGDALEYLAAHGHEFDLIHASPPCQAYSRARMLQGNDHPDLVGPTRELLIASGKPYIIENVVGAPLINPIRLTGTMFGLLTVRPRLFESNLPIPMLLEPPFAGKHAKMGSTCMWSGMCQTPATAARQWGLTG